jgi:predicted 3-demethylubiquinone-9 3-methyltransferase (glyoxalase superfamily)
MADQRIVPHLWFDDAAEEAARLYAGLIPGSEVGEIRLRQGGLGRARPARGQGDDGPIRARRLPDG